MTTISSSLKPMRRLIILPLFAIALVLIYSCGKDGKAAGFSQSSAQLIAGKWTLQQEKVVQYIDGVAHTDTTFNTASNNVATVQFNKNGTFSSISLYSSNNGFSNLNSEPITTADSTSGVYSFAGTKFNVSAPLAGLGSGGIAFSTVNGLSATTPVVFSSVSNSIEITELTANRLSLHTENVYTITTNNVAQTYKNECNYYYSR